MTARIEVFLLQELMGEIDLSGRTAVVIDVLRASTTIVQALQSGASEIVPCLEVDEARATAARIGSTAILAGERHGRLIPGFNLGNSPQEFTPQAVRGRSVVFSTTNGTRALRQCRRAESVVLAAFTNFSVVCQYLAQAADSVIVCAGTDRQITREDVLLAGALVHDRQLAGRVDLNDQARLAADAWKKVEADFSASQPLAEHLRDTQGARNLIELGMERDIAIAAEIDRYEILPVLDTEHWRIRLQ